MHFGAKRRDPDNELYDHACELVESAAAVRAAAADPESADAVPALLGCMEAALRDLACVAGELEQAVAPNGDAGRRALTERGYRNLRAMLDDAAAAAHAAQGLAARAARR